MNQTNNKTEVKRSWWYTTFRTIGHFCFRNWWLILLLFAISLITTSIYIYQLRKKEIICCIKYDRAQKQLINLEKLLANCQSCKINKPIDTAVKGEIKACDFKNDNAGGKGRISTNHKLGNNPGTVTIQYHMENIPDQMDVYYDGQLVATTNGLVSGEGTISWVYTPQNGKPDFCIVIMTAPNDGTSWTYYIRCPKQL